MHYKCHLVAWPKALHPTLSGLLTSYALYPCMHLVNFIVKLDNELLLAQFMSTYLCKSNLLNVAHDLQGGIVKKLVT